MSTLRRLLALSTVGIALGLAGCAWLWPGVPDDGVEARSSKPRELHPSVSEADASVLARGNAAFAFTLYAAVVEQDENLFFSPFSISSALAMTYAGARTNTALQMAEALHFELEGTALHPAFDAIDLALNARDKVGAPYEGEGFQLTVVNAMWGQRDLRFRSSFLDTLATYYGAGVRLMDFAGDPEGSRAEINEWIGEQTRDRIGELLPADAVDSSTRLVLTNAVYFKAPWLFPFAVSDTRTEPFKGSDGMSVPVSMMHQTQILDYARVGSVQAVQLPYNGKQLAMVLLVPDAGTFEQFEATLDEATYNAVVGALSSHQVHLGLPRFSLGSELPLSDALRTLGMTDAFDPGKADFSGVDGARDLYICDAFHKASVSVDELGTEAAAATAVVICVTGMPPQPATLTIDRPFVVVIRDIPTNTILFLGRVVVL